MTYAPQTWHDLPTTDTPIIAARLGYMENGIAAATAAAAAAQATADAGGGGGGSAATVIQVHYNTVTGVWPLRTSVTSSATQVVIWVGDATLPTGVGGPIGGVDWWMGPVSGPTVTANPTPPDPPITISMSAVSTSSSGTTWTLSGTITTLQSTPIKYMKITVLSPTGAVADVGLISDATVNGVQPLSGTLTATETGDWTAHISYNRLGGPNPIDWTDGAVTTFTVGSSGGGGPTSFPQIYLTRSGLQWNSGAFYGGTDAGDATGSPASTLRSKAMDVYLTFQSRGSWSELHSIDSSWAGFPGILVISIPFQPEGQNDAATAVGTNDARWTAYGTALASAGLNRARTVIRLGWEQNGNWYDWAWGGSGNTPASYVAAYKKVVNAVKVHAPLVKFNTNYNRNNKDGRGPTDWKTVTTQLVGYADIVGLDCYDMYSASKTDAQWIANQLNQDPGLTSVATFCRANGMLMSLDEWAPVASTGAGGTGGGDNPYYITRMWDWLIANADVIAYESFYDHVGTSDYNHLITDGSKPNAANAYRSHLRWGNL